MSVQLKILVFYSDGYLQMLREKSAKFAIVVVLAGFEKFTNASFVKLIIKQSNLLQFLLNNRIEKKAFRSNTSCVSFEEITTL